MGIVRVIVFSAVVSLGDQIDVQFHNPLGPFALDRDTRDIVLYIVVHDTRKFTPPTRAAAQANLAAVKSVRARRKPHSSVFERLFSSGTWHFRCTPPSQCSP
jgi:acyl-CoA synthetase (NDP forming)